MKTTTLLTRHCRQTACLESGLWARVNLHERLPLRIEDEVGSQAINAGVKNRGPRGNG